MKIQHIKNNDFTGRVNVILDKEELNGKTEVKLKSLRKKIRMPGFRPGKVPMSLIKKQYGEAARAEALEKLLTEALSDFKKEQKLELIGQFLPVKNDENEKNNDQIIYSFDYAEIPPFEIDWEKIKQNKIYKIEISDEDLEKEIEYLQQKHAKIEDSDKFEEGTVFIGYVKAKDNKEIFTLIHLKYEDTYKKTAATLDKLDKDEMELTLAEAKKKKIINKNITDELKQKGATDETVLILKKLGIKKFIPAEINEEFFNLIFPGKKLKSEEEFRKALREDMEKQWNHNMKMNIQNTILSRIDEYVKMDIPLDFLKRWIKETEEITDEEKLNDLLNEYIKYYKYTSWINRFIKEENPTFSREELISKATSDLYHHMLSNPQQFPNLPAFEEIQSLAEYYLQDEKYKTRMEQQLIDDRFIDYVYSQLTEKTEPETITVEEYRKKSQSGQ